MGVSDTLLYFFTAGEDQLREVMWTQECWNIEYFYMIYECNM